MFPCFHFSYFFSTPQVTFVPTYSDMTLSFPRKIITHPSPDFLLDLLSFLFPTKKVIDLTSKIPFDLKSPTKVKLTGLSISQSQLWTVLYIHSIWNIFHQNSTSKRLHWKTSCLRLLSLDLYSPRVFYELFNNCISTQCLPYQPSYLRIFFVLKLNHSDPHKWFNNWSID